MFKVLSQIVSRDEFLMIQPLKCLFAFEPISQRQEQQGDGIGVKAFYFFIIRNSR